MECKHTGENLSAYLDGELEPREEKALESHLESCKSCRDQLERLRSTVRLVRSLPRAQAPAVLKSRLVAAVGARRPGFRLASVPALLTAAALVLVSVLAVFMLIPHRHVPSKMTVARTEQARPAAEETSEAPPGARALRRRLPDARSPASKEFAKAHAADYEGKVAPPAPEPAARPEFEYTGKGKLAREIEQLEEKPAPARPVSDIYAGRYRRKAGPAEPAEEMEEAAPKPAPVPRPTAPAYGEALAKLEKKLDGIAKRPRAEFDELKAQLSKNELAQADKALPRKKARAVDTETRVYVIETDDITRTKEAVNKLYRKYYYEMYHVKSPFMGLPEAPGKEKDTGAEFVLLHAPVERGYWQEFVAGLDALKVQATPGRLKPSEREIAQAAPGGLAKEGRERRGKWVAPTKKAARRAARIGEDAFGQAPARQAAPALKSAKEPAAEAAQQQPTAKQEKKEKAAPAKRIALCIKIRKRAAPAAIEAARGERALLRAKGAAAKKK